MLCEEVATLSCLPFEKEVSPYLLDHRLNDMKQEIEQCIKTQEEFEKEHNKGKNEKTYADLAKQISLLRKFDWIDTNNPLIKSPPIKLLTPMAYWFMVCAEYFPRNLMINQNPIQYLEEAIPTLSKNNSQEQQHNLELVSKITQELKAKSYQKPPTNTKSLAELKEDYSLDDDIYIMSVRSDLLDMYMSQCKGETLPSINAVAQGSYHSSESTMEEEDSRLLQSPAEEEFESKKSSTNKQEAIEIKQGKTEDTSVGIIEEEECEKKRERNIEDLLDALKQQDLDDIINMYSQSLVEQEKQTSHLVSALKENISKEYQAEHIIYKPGEVNLEDVLVDIHQYCSVELEYLNFLENKQQFTDMEIKNSKSLQCCDAQIEHQNERESNQMIKCQMNPGENKTKKSASQGKSNDVVIIEDIKCQICNDGDYTDDDLIVFCSKCNISVHQRCYGIPQVPADDWICEVCLSFGPQGKYLRCGLCPQRGGALKPSKIPINSLIFQHTNLPYYEFQKTCTPSTSNKKQRYEEESSLVSQQYYDFHELKNEFTEEELLNEPKPHFVWCHITCALWTPECFFDDKNYYSNVKGLESIDKHRFKLDCSICKQKRAGACIQCAKNKCMDAFHPECARRAKIFMEIRNTDKLAYLIYCERHTPLKLRRLLEHKDKKYKEEIFKFCKCIERSREFKKKEKIHKPVDKQLEKDNKNALSKKKVLLSSKKIQQQLTKNADDIKREEIEFQKTLISSMINYLDKQNQSAQQEIIQDEKQGESLQNHQKQLVRWQNKIFMNRDEPFWNEIVFKQLQPIQLYKRYKRIIKDAGKKIEFKKLYFRTLSALKGIRIVTKEERVREKERKKQQKLLKLQQAKNSNLKVHEIFLKAQQNFKKKSNSQNKKEQFIQLKISPQQFTQQKQIQPQQEQEEEKLQIFFEQEEQIEKIIPSQEQELEVVIDIPISKEQDQQNHLQEIVEYQPEYIIAPNYEPVDGKKSSYFAFVDLCSIDTSEKVFCICKKKYQEGDQMMACEKCEEWYHFECIGFIGTMEQAGAIDFVCEDCERKDKNQKAKQARKKQYGHLFCKQIIQPQLIEDEKKNNKLNKQNNLELSHKSKDKTKNQNLKRKNEFKEEVEEANKSKKLLKRTITSVGSPSDPSIKNIYEDSVIANQHFEECSSEYTLEDQMKEATKLQQQQQLKHNEEVEVNNLFQENSIQKDTHEENQVELLPEHSNIIIPVQECLNNENEGELMSKDEKNKIEIETEASPSPNLQKVTSKQEQKQKIKVDSENLNIIQDNDTELSAEKQEAASNIANAVNKKQKTLFEFFKKK